MPSRTFLKLCSSRQHTETIRKIESDERKKKLAERMETADETEKATLTSKLARKRQQDLAMVSREKGGGGQEGQRALSNGVAKDDLVAKDS